MSNATKRNTDQKNGIDDIDDKESLRQSIWSELNYVMVRKLSKVRAENERQFEKLRADYRRRDWFLIVVTVLAFLSVLLSWGALFLG